MVASPLPPRMTSPFSRPAGEVAIRAAGGGVEGHPNGHSGWRPAPRRAVVRWARGLEGRDAVSNVGWQATRGGQQPGTGCGASRHRASRTTADHVSAAPIALCRCAPNGRFPRKPEKGRLGAPSPLCTPSIAHCPLSIITCLTPHRGKSPLGPPQAASKAAPMGIVDGGPPRACRGEVGAGCGRMRGGLCWDGLCWDGLRCGWARRGMRLCG